MASKKSGKPASRSQTPRRSGRQGAAGRRDDSYRPSAAEPGTPHERLTPLEHYHREKARRTGERGADTVDPLEEARREYRAMLAADAAKQKGGRPKKAAARPPAPAEQEDEVPDAEVEVEGDGDVDAAEQDQGDAET